MLSPFKSKRLFIGRLEHGADLIESITALCRKHRITCGYFSLIGAVQKAVVGYYDQGRKKYRPPHVFDKKLEVLSCSGTISLKDGAPFVHAHIVLSGPDGKAFGGHIMDGTIVFAAEIVLQEAAGRRLVRTFDPQTGLSLWH